MQYGKYPIRFSWTNLVCPAIEYFGNKYIHSWECEKKTSPFISSKTSLEMSHLVHLWYTEIVACHQKFLNYQAEIANLRVRTELSSHHKK